MQLTPSKYVRHVIHFHLRESEPTEMQAWQALQPFLRTGQAADLLRFLVVEWAAKRAEKRAIGASPFQVLYTPDTPEVLDSGEDSESP